MKVAILDYGVGNLYSLQCALDRKGASPVITSNVPKSGEVDAMILPGVGSFTPVAKKLATCRNELLGLVENGLPILGICLGLQLLFKRSEEGEGSGLGLIDGEVVKLPSTVKVPQMGWNNLRIREEQTLTKGIMNNSWVYFVHSYYPKPRDSEVVEAETTYGITFPAIISKKNIHGTQFHPEKSGKVGSNLLGNFLDTARR